MFRIVLISLMLFVSLYANKVESKAWMEAKLLFQKASQGKEEDVLTSLEMFKKLEQSAIRDAHIGSLTTMLAKYTYLPWQKINYVKNGSKLLDTSIRIEPDNLKVRFLRFFTYIKLPDMLGKESFLQEDVRYFIKIYNTQTQDETINNELLNAIVQFFHKYEDFQKRDKYFSKITDSDLKAKLSKKIAG